MSLDDTFASLEFWKYLPYETLLQYCRTNRKMQAICTTKEFWIYLLNRDFPGMEYNTNASEQYRRYHRIVQYWSAYFPIITQYAIALIDKFIPEKDWPLMINASKEVEPMEEILDTENFLEIFEEFAFIENDYYERRDEMKHHIFRIMRKYIVNSEEMSHNMQKYPLTIYVRGKPKIVTSNLEIFEFFYDEFGMTLGYDWLNMLKHPLGNSR